MATCIFTNVIHEQILGAIELSIATMSKADRASVEEIYTVGFVPSYLLPDQRPNSLDPFLEPLVTDLERGFIEGNYYQAC